MIFFIQDFDDKLYCLSIVSCRRIDFFQIKKLWQIGFTLCINYHPKTLLQIKPIRKNTQSNKAFLKKNLVGSLFNIEFFRAFKLNSYSSLRILFIHSAKLQPFKNVKERGKETDLLWLTTICLVNSCTYDIT